MRPQFVGIPYVPHGRDYAGADCWGILYLYYRDVLQKPVPSYSAEMQEREFHRRDIGPLISDEKALHWRQVDVPEIGDCVLMRTGRHPTHVGVYLGEGRMLHSEGPHPSAIERLDDLRIRNRIIGYYRFNG